MNTHVSYRYNEIKGEEAWRENIRLAYLVHNRIRSTLGPKGAYKMVTYNRGPEQVVKISKDVVPVLDEIGFQYPVVKIMSEAAKMQREDDGDGVTQFVVFLTALLMNADKLISMGIHPNILVKGFDEATKRAVDVVDRLATPIGAEAYESVLDCIDCGRGLLTPKLRESIIKASGIVIRDGKIDSIRLRMIRKMGKGIDETQLIRGVVIKSHKVHGGMPDHVQAPRLAILSGRVGISRVSVKMKGEGPAELELTIRNPSQIEDYKYAELEIKLAAIRKLKELGIDVLLCGQPIDDSVRGELAKQGIYALERVDQADLIGVSRATGARVVGSIGDLGESDLGSAESLDTEWIEPDRVTVIRGCEAATFILRGSTAQAIDELEDVIQNAVKAIRLLRNDGRTVPGGGAVEFFVASDLRNHALGFPGREQLAIVSFADALSAIPRVLAENLGFEPIDVIAQLNKCQLEDIKYGIGANGCASSVCHEPVKTKLDVYRRVYDVASMMLRINELLVGFR